MDIERILKGTRVIAVVGLSDKPDRPSSGVASYLLGKGYRILPINPNISEWKGIKAHAKLEDIKDHVDVVCIFRKPHHVEKIVEEAAAIGTSVIWMQEGIVNEKAAAKARVYGMKVVMDKCMMKEYEKLEG